MSINDSSLQLYFKLDEIQNGKIIDLSGRERHGTVKGNPKVVKDSIFGNCLYFDGTDDYIELTSANELGLKDSSFTVEAWVNTDLSDGNDLNIKNNLDKTILGSDSSKATNQCLHLVVRERPEQKGVFKAHLGFFNNDTQGNTKLLNNTWYHIAWRYNKIESQEIESQEQAIFINGVLDNKAINRKAFEGDGKTLIGKWNIDQEKKLFFGKMFGIRVYNRALSQEEILQNMMSSIFTRLHDELKELRSLKETWETVKQKIGNFDISIRDDIPSDIHEILVTLKTADTTHQVLILSSQADQDRDQAEKAKEEAKLFAEKAKEEASNLSPDSVEATKAQDAANQAQDAAEETEKQFKKAEEAAKNIKNLVNSIVTPNSKIPSEADGLSSDVPPSSEADSLSRNNQNSEGETSSDTSTETKDEAERKNLENTKPDAKAAKKAKQYAEVPKNVKPGAEVPKNSDQETSNLSSDSLEKAKKYAEVANTAKYEAIKQRDIAEQMKNIAADCAQKAGQYYDNWETIGNMFGFSNGTYGGKKDSDDGNFPSTPEPDHSEDKFAEYDNWKVIQNLFGL